MPGISLGLEDMQCIKVPVIIQLILLRGETENKLMRKYIMLDGDQFWGKKSSVWGRWSDWVVCSKMRDILKNGL